VPLSENRWVAAGAWLGLLAYSKPFALIFIAWLILEQAGVGARDGGDRLDRIGRAGRDRVRPRHSPTVASLTSTGRDWLDVALRECVGVGSVGKSFQAITVVRARARADPRRASCSCVQVSSPSWLLPGR